MWPVTAYDPGRVEQAFRGGGRRDRGAQRLGAARRDPALDHRAPCLQPACISTLVPAEGAGPRGRAASTRKGQEQHMTESISESENPAIPSPTPEVPSPRTNRDWWPNQLDLTVLHRHSPLSDPMGEGFDYAKEFGTLDLDALKSDLIELMTTSQDW